MLMQFSCYSCPESTSHWWLEAQTLTDQSASGYVMDYDEKKCIRHCLKYLCGHLDPRTHIYRKCLEDSGPYLPCLPSEEYSLWPNYTTVIHKLQVGNTTFKLWLPLDKFDDIIPGFQPMNESLPLMLMPPIPPISIHL